MKAQFDNATLKLWFHTGTSRNIFNVKEVEHVEDIMLITDKDGQKYLVNWGQVTLIEELKR